MINSFMRAARVFEEHLRAFALVCIIGATVVAPAVSVAQNLGNTPATGKAVQGQTAAQPEGAFLNARQLGMQRDLPRWRRHSRRRNYLAMAEWPQLAAFSNDRGRTDLRFRHPAAH